MINPDSEDQVLRVKLWFQKYGKLIVVAIVLIFIGIGIRQYWYWYHQVKLDQARQDFNTLVAHLDSKNEKSSAALVQFANTQNNNYGVFAALKAAQFYAMDKKDYSQAEKILTGALSKTKEDELHDILLLRIARLQLQQQQLTESLATLDKIKGTSWIPLAAQVRGDVYFKQQKYSESIAAYQEALNTDQNVEARKILQIKLNQAQFLLKKASHPVLEK